MALPNIDRREFLVTAGVLTGTLPSCVRSAPGGLAHAPPAPPPRIDGHQHFWTYDAQNYGWIEPTSVVARNFGPGDLEPELAAGGVAGTIVVEARSQIDETEDLLGFAGRTGFVRGVVGWLPLVDPNVGALIERYGADPHLRGLRHALAAEADPEYMFRADFNAGVARLEPAGLRFDLLLVPALLGRAARFVDAHPRQIFILDHLAKPDILRHALEPWATDLRELAKRPNVYCKVSGLVTCADPRAWAPSDLRPYLEVAVEAFTPRRLLFGSDWPMCLLASSYGRWLETAEAWAAASSADERARLFGGTAIEAYGL